MMRCCGQTLRRADQTKVPISLTLDRDTSVGTKLGGAVSIFSVMFISAFMISEFYNLIWQPKFYQEFLTEYIEQAIHPQTFNVNTLNQFTFAARLIDTNEVKADNITEYLVVEFFSAYWADEDTELSFKWYNAVPCKEKYPNSTPVIAKEFEEEGWLCPDIDEFTIYNDPDLFDFGENFNLVINHCKVSNPDDPNCKNITEGEEYLNEIRINHKFITQYFNGYLYEEQGSMDYIAIYRTENDLLKSITGCNKYQLALTHVDFFAKKFIDLSDVTLFNIAQKIDYFSVEYNGYSIFTRSASKRNFGIYFAAVNQSPKVVTEQWAIQTFDIILANIGGYASFIWTLVIILIGGYQDFNFEKTLIRRLYTMDSKIANYDNDEYDLPDNVADSEKDEFNSKARQNVQDISAQRTPMLLNLELMMIDKCKCCFGCKRFEKGKQKLLAFKEAAERLGEEQDIITLIKVLRVAKLLANTKLRKEQKYLVNMFQNYHVSFKDIDIKYNPDDLEPEINEEFFDKFSPTSDAIDKVIYERIFKKQEKDYQAIGDFDPLAMMGLFFKQTLQETKDFGSKLTHVMDGDEDDDPNNQLERKKTGGLFKMKTSLFGRLLTKKTVNEEKDADDNTDGLLQGGDDPESGKHNKPQSKKFSINDAENAIEEESECFSSSSFSELNNMIDDDGIEEVY